MSNNITNKLAEQMLITLQWQYMPLKLCVTNADKLIPARNWDVGRVWTKSIKAHIPSIIVCKQANTLTKNKIKYIKGFYIT